MTYVIQQLLNEFISRDYTLKEMAEVLTNLADYEEAKKKVEDPTRFESREHDTIWLNSCKLSLESTLEWNALEDFKEELL